MAIMCYDGQDVAGPLDGMRGRRWGVDCRRGVSGPPCPTPRVGSGPSTPPPRPDVEGAASQTPRIKIYVFFMITQLEQIKLSILSVSGKCNHV